MRVLVCGGRDFADANLLWRVLDEIHYAWPPITHVIHGGAKGADELAGQWVSENDMPAYVYRADWKAHGRAAGPKRNQTMLDEGKPALVVAFPGGRGTADMVRRAKAAGVPVREITP